MEPATIASFLWGAIASGATYDLIKNMIPAKIFSRLEKAKDEGKKEEFAEEVSTLGEYNPQLLEEIAKLMKKGSINQTHFGKGDNVGGDKIVYGREK